MSSFFRVADDERCDQVESTKNLMREEETDAGWGIKRSHMHPEVFSLRLFDISKIPKPVCHRNRSHYPLKLPQIDRGGNTQEIPESYEKMFEGPSAELVGKVNVTIAFECNRGDSSFFPYHAASTADEGKAWRGNCTFPLASLYLHLLGSQRNVSDSVLFARFIDWTAVLLPQWLSVAHSSIRLCQAVQVCSSFSLPLVSFPISRIPPHEIFARCHFLYQVFLLIAISFLAPPPFLLVTSVFACWFHDGIWSDIHLFLSLSQCVFFLERGDASFPFPPISSTHCSVSSCSYRQILWSIPSSLLKRGRSWVQEEGLEKHRHPHEWRRDLANRLQTGPLDFDSLAPFLFDRDPL